MKIKQITLPFKKRQGWCKSLWTACWHIGNGAMHRDGMDRLLKECEKWPWVQLGDIIEAIAPNDPRYEADHHSDTIMAEIHDAIDYVERAPDTCMGICKGNHEGRASRTMGSITEFICKQVWGTQKGHQYNLRGAAYLRLVAPEGGTTVFCGHSRISMSYSAGTSKQIHESKKRKLQNKLRKFMADAKIVAHGHQFVCAPPIAEKMLVYDTKAKREKRVPVATNGAWHIMVPSMFMVYDSDAKSENYAEDAMYDPTEIGWVECIHGRDGKIQEVHHISEKGETLAEIRPEVVA